MVPLGSNIEEPLIGFHIELRAFFPSDPSSSDDGISLFDLNWSIGVDVDGALIGRSLGTRCQ